MNIEVTELLAKTLENMVKNAVRASIENVSTRHGLDLEAELKAVGLDTAKLVRKAMPKSSKVKAVKEVKVKVAKSSFPLPFSAEHVNSECCQGISYNRGLFTQCPKSQMESGSFCKSCQSEADGSASGKPSCGTVGERLACGLYEYTDAKGRKPLPYLLVLEKLKLSLPEEIEIDEEHLTAKKVSKSKKSERGRPKKAALSVTVDEPADLFSQLQPEEEEEEVEQEQVAEEKPSKSKKLNDSEKAEKKAALEAEKAEKLAAKKAALEAEREAKKAALEAEKAEKLEAKKAALEAEKATKKAALEAEKAEKLEAKKAALEAEKEAKKAAQKPKAAEKKAEKPKAAQKKAEKSEEQVQEKEQEQSPATTPAKVSASRVKIDGVEYLKTGENILYNPATKEAVGLWNPATKEIEELPEDSDEEEEEDYESEEEN